MSIYDLHNYPNVVYNFNDSAFMVILASEPIEFIQTFKGIPLYAPNIYTGFVEIL